MNIFLYFLLLSQILLASCSHTLVPTQVLLPKTSFYRSKKTNQLLSITVQFVLKVEPPLCANWKLQDSDVLLFDKSNYTALQVSRDLGDSDYHDNYSENDFKGCSSNVVITTLPLNLKDDPTDNTHARGSSDSDELKDSLDYFNNDVRTFVFAYDSKFRFHSVTEVVISKIDRLTVETAYRKVSKNQVFSLKLRGLDREGNTFSSLEGLPFYVSFSGPRIFDIMDLKEGELSSEKRSNVLSQNEFFNLPEGTTLVTDIVLLKGVKVGRSTLTFGLFLDEYSKIVSPPVQFVVNDFVVLSHQNLYMLNNTSFQLHLKYPTTYLFPNGKDERVNWSNYEWSTDADPSKLTVSKKGLLQSHITKSTENEESSSDPLEKDFKCVVYAKDVRTGEVLKTFVNVMKPHSMMLRYASMQALNNCLLSKNMLLSKDLNRGESMDRYLEKLAQMDEDDDCYSEEVRDTIYLYENAFYLFKFNLLTYNKNVFNTFDGNLAKFAPVDADKDFEEDELIKLQGSKNNHYLYKASNVGCDYYNLVYSNASNPDDPLSFKYKVCVLEQVRLEGYECNTKHKLSNNYEYLSCEKPLVVSVGDLFEVNPAGGSGKFKFELEGCYSESNKFVCSRRGSFQLKVVDQTHEENGMLIQVVATTVESSSFEYAAGDQNSEYVRVKPEEELTSLLRNTFKLKLNLYGNLNEVKPMFKKSFSQEDAKFYSFNYFNDGNHLVSLREKYTNLVNLQKIHENGHSLHGKDVKLLLYEKKVLELKSMSTHEGSLVMSFLTLNINSSKLSLNLELLEQFYKGYLGEEAADFSLNEAKFDVVYVNVYKDPELHVNEKYKLPIINIISLSNYRVGGGATGEAEFLANVALGSRVELNYNFVLKSTTPKLTTNPNSAVLHVEELEDAQKRGFMVYCLSVGAEELVFEFLEYKKTYRISCNFPKYNAVYPLNRLSSEVYELVDLQKTPDPEKFLERRYNVTDSKHNTFVNLLFDANNNLLLPSNLYKSDFELYSLNATLTVTSSYADKGVNEQLLFSESNALFQFLPSEFEGAKRNLKLVGRYRYENESSNYSSKFNKVRKYKRMNQLVSAQVKSSWTVANKLYCLASHVLLFPKHKPSFSLLPHDLDSDNSLYLMYNKMFVYRMFISGGSGHYSLLSPPGLNYKFSNEFVFPNALKNSEQLEAAQWLPVNENDKFVLINLFNYKSLRGIGRFLSFTAPNTNDLSLVIKDDNLLWQEILNLQLHFRYPNKFKFVFEPLTYKVSKADDKQMELLEGKEEILYVNEKYKVKLNGFYNSHHIMDNTLLWVLNLFNNNVTLKTTNALKDHALDEHLSVRDDELLVRGSDELVMATWEQGNSGLTIQDLERTMKRVYKFRLLNKLLLDHGDVTVLTGTKFDIAFKNLNDYNQLKLSATTTNVETGEKRTLEKYALTFNELGTFRYDVSVMYSDNDLTMMDHKLIVSVSKPAKMMFHLSGLSNKLPLRAASKLDEFIANSHSKKDESVSEFTLDKGTVVNLNVILFDEHGNIFTPLYLTNPNLEFTYQLSNACYLLNTSTNAHPREFTGTSGQGAHSAKLGVGGATAAGSSKSDSASTRDSLGDFGGHHGARELVTNRFNVLLFVNGDSELVVTSKYLGVPLQSKKIKFKTRPEEKLFSVGEEVRSIFGLAKDLTKSSNSAISGQKVDSDSCGACCVREEEDNLCYGGIYEINKSFTSYPENRLKELGNRSYQVTTLGNVLIMTDVNSYNVRLLKPTHFSLVPMNVANNNSFESGSSAILSRDSSGSSSDLSLKNSHSQADYTTHNMFKMVFRVVLFSNGKRMKMPLNTKFKLSMKDMSVFSYEMEGDVLTVTPHKCGETTLEMVFSLGHVDQNLALQAEDADPSSKPDWDNNEINRYFVFKSKYHDVSNVFNVMAGSKVYLTGSRITSLIVNLDVNSYEFTKLIKNKFMLKSFGTCLGDECGMVYMNKSEYIDSVKKLKNTLSMNRTSYKMLLNVVTNALNSLFNMTNDQAGLTQAKNLLSLNKMLDSTHCVASYCWLELKYHLTSPISVERLNSVNNHLHYGNKSYKMNDEMEDVLRMLNSTLLGVDNSMWNSGSGGVQDLIVETSKPGKFKFKNVNNEEVEANVTPFNAPGYKFKQVDNYNLLLLPHLAGAAKSEEALLGNYGNVLYFNYALNYKFGDPQLNKLFFLKPAYYPYYYNVATGNSSSDQSSDSAGDSGSSDSNLFLYRLGYNMLLSNQLNKEWSIFKNQLRTMSTDALKGKHKLTLELYHHYNKHAASSGGKDSHSSSREDAKDHADLIFRDELEVYLPENVLFVNSDGLILNELGEANMNNILHVYPVNSSHKLYLNSSKYVIKTIERSGQLTTFIIYTNVSSNAVEGKKASYKHGPLEPEADGAGNTYLMVLNNNDNIIGKIKINLNVATYNAVNAAKLTILSKTNWSDILMSVMALLVILFLLFVYNTIRNHQYYQPTVPIKLERNLPKVFEHLYQTNYHNKHYHSVR